MFRVRMKQLLGSGVFWGTVLPFAVIMVAGAYTDLPAARVNSSSVLYLYLVTSTVGIAHVLVPVVTILPFAFFYVEEMEKKAVYYNLIRSSKRAYYGSNIAAAVLSSMLVSAFGLLIFVLVCLGYGAVFGYSDAVLSFFEGSIYGDWLTDGRHVWVLLVKLLAFVVLSAPWGVLCLAVSVFSRNKYVILAAPFLIEWAVSVVLQMLGLWLLDPGMTLLNGPGLRLPFGGIPYSLGYNGALVAILSTFYYVMSKRRYRREGI